MIQEFDKTQLTEKVHGQDVHRDYYAHYSRWAWTFRQLPKHSRIIDVGCGADTPFAKITTGIRGHRAIEPLEMVAIDLNKIKAKVGSRKWLTMYEKFDFTTRYNELISERTPEELFDVAVCFEVIEHMDIISADKLLAGLYDCMKPTGRVYLSTPVFSGKAAANHIHEYGIDELKEKIEHAGFEVLDRKGTFGDVNKIKKACTVAEREILEEVATWHGNDMASVFFAWKYPDHCKNNLWVIGIPGQDKNVVRKDPSPQPPF